jgi:hypothetical protein
MKNQHKILLWWKAQEGNKALKESKVCRENKESRDRMENKGLKVKLAHRGKQVLLDLKDPQDQEVHREKRDLKDL